MFRVWCLVNGLSGQQIELTLKCNESKNECLATDLGHPYWIYIIPTHDMHQWLLLQFLVLLMMDAESVRNM